MNTIKTNWVIQWTKIYPVDIAIHLLNNRGQIVIYPLDKINRHLNNCGLMDKLRTVPTNSKVFLPRFMIMQQM